MNIMKIFGATSKQPVAQFPKVHMMVVGALTALTVGVAVLPSSNGATMQKNEIPLTIAFETSTDIETIVPETVVPHTVVPIEEHSSLGNWHNVVIKSGDSISKIFEAQGLGPDVVYAITSTSHFGEMLSKVRPGENLDFRKNDLGELTQFRYILSPLESVLFEKTDSGYSAQEVIRTPQIQTATVAGTINSSLFVDSQAAGLSHNVIMEMASIFGWDIDFVQDIRKGDTFRVIFEEKYLDGKKLSDGNILAAEFTNQGETYTAIRYTDSSNKTDYYSPDGQSMKKAFLRTPVEFTRISSVYNPNRLHPIFKTKRPHRGVDYAAPMNTPIKAAGDGRIKFAGWQDGYGNVVFIEHPNNIITVYAHANKLGRYKTGQKVQQGDIIAYVGKTGWATGPHLHYEFRVNNSHRNPMTVRLPDAQPLARKEMTAFKEYSKVVLAQLGHSSERTMLASQ